MSAKHVDLAIEEEANCFARHLLVPSSLLRAEVAKIGPIDIADDSDGRVKKLAKIFGVSPTLIVFRLAEEAQST